MLVNQYMSRNNEFVVNVDYISVIQIFPLTIIFNSQTVVSQQIQSLHFLELWLNKNTSLGRKVFLMCSDAKYERNCCWDNFSLRDVMDKLGKTPKLSVL